MRMSPLPKSWITMLQVPYKLIVWQCTKSIPWICVVFFTAMKILFTCDGKQDPRKRTFHILRLLKQTVRNTGWSVLEIFSAPPRKSLDNHSKTSHRSSCFPHSFFEVVEYENYYFFVLTLFLTFVFNQQVNFLPPFHFLWMYKTFWNPMGCWQQYLCYWLDWLKSMKKNREKKKCHTIGKILYSVK